MLIGSGNKLTNLHQLYCGSDGIDKSLVKIFVEGSLDDVKENFQVSNISSLFSKLHVSLVFSIIEQSQYGKLATVTFKS